MRWSALLAATCPHAVFAAAAAASPACGAASLPEAHLPRGFCAHALVELDATQPRGVLRVPDSPGDVLVVERATSRVLAIRDTDADGTPDAAVPVATGAAGLNHGLALRGDFIYASAPTTVYRWPAGPALRADGSAAADPAADPVAVVAGMSADGNGGAPQGHKTRTLIFDAAGHLYVSIGSVGNVDTDSFRSRIRRFHNDSLTAVDGSGGPLDFVNDGEVFADGLRNEVGLAFDRHGVLWGVENGADRLVRDDLGGDIHNENPAEELNRFPERDRGKHWGYPYCFTQGAAALRKDGDGTDSPRGTVWAWPGFPSSFNDSWCRARTVRPELAMQAHSAPLGVTFYRWQETWPAVCQTADGTMGAFPREYDGWAFVAFHGSWNRDPPTGYKIVAVEVDPATGRVAEGSRTVDILSHDGASAKWGSGMRPVDLTFDGCGRLVFTSDGTSRDWRGGLVGRVAYDAGYVAAAPSSPSSSLTGPCCGAVVDGQKRAESAAGRRRGGGGWGGSGGARVAVAMAAGAAAAAAAGMLRSN